VGETTNSSLGIGVAQSARMLNHLRWCVGSVVAAMLGCGDTRSSSTEQAVAVNVVVVADAGTPGGDAGGPPPDAGFPDARFPDGGAHDAAFPDGSFPDGSAIDGGAPDGGPPDIEESDGIDPIVDPTPIGMPDPQLDNCDDLAQRDAQGISLPDDNQRSRSYQCFARYISRVGEPQLAPQDPSYSPVDTFDGVIPYPTRIDPDTAQYETDLFQIAAPPAPNEVLNLLKGVDLQGIADDKYGCEPVNADHIANPKSGDIWQYQYFPGIQATDTVPFLTNAGTANRYNQAAEWGADSQNNINTFTFPVSEISRWRLFHYHNEPDATAGKNGGPVSKVFKKRNWIGPPGKIVGSVENFSLKTHRTTFEDDKKEVRMLAAWVSSVNQANFTANPPVPGAGTTAAIIKAGGPQITPADFVNWYNGRIAEKAKGEFQWFMRQAAFVAAHSYYCRKPIFAHSGGGPVKLFILRLLDAYSESLPGKPLRTIRARNAIIWRAYGLEEVISKEVRDIVEALPSYQDKLVIYNYVEDTGGQNGSNTWRDLIRQEIRNVNQTPLVKEYQDMHITIAPGTSGHAWIGWTPLYTGVFFNPKTFFPAY
jgi:hypothetical protein